MLLNFKKSENRGKSNFIIIAWSLRFIWYIKLFSNFPDPQDACSIYILLALITKQDYNLRLQSQHIRVNDPKEAETPY